MTDSLQPNSNAHGQGRIEQRKLSSTIMAMARRLQIYLPPSYDTQPARCYPVLYVHSGQRIFEPQRPGDEAWHLHHLLDVLILADRIEEILVVGIAAERLTYHSDYSHYVPVIQDAILGGVTFESFIIQELKPFIDHTYRTLPEPEQTAMIGASTSAMLTYNIAHRHPHIFGKIGMLSPLVYSLHEQRWLYPTPIPKYSGLLWICMGDAEGEYTFHVRDLLDALLAQGFTPGEDLFYTLMPDAGHHDQAWGEQMIHPLLLFFGKAGTTPIERIGRPLVVELLGDDKMGVGGEPLVVNPLVHYDTGFCMTVLAGEYSVGSSHILAVQPYNRLYGLVVGESTVTFTFNGVAATRTYRVMSTLADMVHIHLRVHTPPKTPDVAQIWFEMYPLLRVNPNYYEGKIMWKRNFALQGLFSWSMHKFEQRADGTLAPYRLLRVTEDTTIEYTVVRWTL